MSKGSKIAGGLMLAVVFGSVAGCAAGCNAVGNNGLGNGYSTGDRVGVVTKISNKGMIWKSWEGELAMQNFATGPDGKASNTFDFSVTDPAVISALQEAQHSGQKVDLTYDQSMVAPWKKQDTTYKIVKVTPAV